MTEYHSAGASARAFPIRGGTPCSHSSWHLGAAFALAATSLGSGLAFGQTATVADSAAAPASLDRIVVTATRSSQEAKTLASSATVLTAAELEARQITSLADALRAVAGTGIVASGAPGGLVSSFMRGTNSNHTLFLVDGMRINDANTLVSSYLGGGDVGNLGRVEVVRGPQSPLYGGAAVGGVIALDSRKGEGKPSASIFGEYGSWDTYTATLSGQGASGPLALSGSYSHGESDNDASRLHYQNATVAASNTPRNDMDRTSAAVRFDYAVTKTLQVGGTFRYLDSDFTSPGDIRTSNTTPIGTTDFSSSLATVFAELTATENWRAKLLLGNQLQRSASRSQFNGGAPSVSTSRQDRRVADFQNTFALPNAVELVAGANFERAKSRSGVTAFEEDLLGFYANAQWKPIKDVNLGVGLRSDDYDTWGRKTTYRVSGAWLVTNALKLRSSYGTGFSPPSFSDRFGSAFQNPNPGILPEKSRGWDVGLDYYAAGDRAVLGVSYFENKLRDLIVFQGGVPLGTRVNARAADIEGVELSLKARPMAQVTTSAAYTYTYGPRILQPGNLLRSRAPRHSFSTDTAYAATKAVNVGAGLTYSAGREDFDFNPFPSQRVTPGGYAVARIYGSYRVSDGLRLSVRVENLFDKVYEEAFGLPALGRGIFGSVEWKF